MCGVDTLSRLTSWASTWLDQLGTPQLLVNQPAHDKRFSRTCILKQASSNAQIVKICTMLSNIDCNVVICASSVKWRLHSVKADSCTSETFLCFSTETLPFLVLPWLLPIPGCFTLGPVKTSISDCSAGGVAFFLLIVSYNCSHPYSKAASSLAHAETSPRSLNQREALDI